MMKHLIKCKYCDQILTRAKLKNNVYFCSKVCEIGFDIDLKK